MSNAMDNRADTRTDNQYAGPIRTYRQVVAAMRKQGDKTITVNQIWYYEQSAFRKLRKLLKPERQPID